MKFDELLQCITYESNIFTISQSGDLNTKFASNRKKVFYKAYNPINGLDTLKISEWNY